MIDNTRLAALRCLEDKLTDARFLVGIVEADSGPSDGSDFLETMRTLLIGFAEWARLNASLLEQQAALGLAVDQYDGRSDLRTDWCSECERQTDHQLIQGGWWCRYCETFPPLLSVVNGGAA